MTWFGVIPLRNTSRNTPRGVILHPKKELQSVVTLCGLTACVIEADGSRTRNHRIDSPVL